MSTQDDTSQDLEKLTANTNETAVDDDEDVEAHGSDFQSNETVVEDDDVEAHRLSANTNETVKSDDD